MPRLRIRHEGWRKRDGASDSNQGKAASAKGQIEFWMKLKLPSLQLADGN